MMAWTTSALDRDNNLATYFRSKSRRGYLNRPKRDSRDSSHHSSCSLDQESVLLRRQRDREEREFHTWRRSHRGDRQEERYTHNDSNPSVIRSFKDWSKGNPRVLPEGMAEDKESEVERRPRIKLKTKREPTMKVKEEVADVTI